MELGLRSGWLTVPVPASPTAAVRGQRRLRIDPEPGAEAPEPELESPSRLGRLAGLDGLRAIAVLAVLLYHSGLDWLPGGFLGVEVFFVISGYLITGLLINEWRVHGRIDLRAFWIRRARRLLPALFVLLAATLAYALAWLPGQLAQLRVDVLAAMGYVTNWYLVLGQQSYFANLDRQSPLLHLWSLAVEEQFYVFWPVVLAAGLWLVGRRVFFVVTLGGALLSAVWMGVLYQPEGDVSRIYYGTDTRLTGLLLGAALAFVWLPRPGRETWLPTSPRWQPLVHVVLDGVALAGLAVIAWFLLAVDESDAFLFHGGLVLLAAATAVAIAAVVHPAGRIGVGVLDLGPLRWLGTRSYSVYLWHWPVFSVTRPGLDIPLDPVVAFALRLVLTATLAELSFRFVETRFRYRGVSVASNQPATGRPLAAKLAWAGSIAAAVMILAGPIATASAPARPTFLSADSIDRLVTVDRRGPGQAAASGLGPAGGVLGRGPTSRTAVSPRFLVDTRPVSRRIVLIGDSVVIAAYEAVAQKVGPVTVDAAIGRSVGEGVAVLRHRAAANDLGDVVIVDLGSNGRLTPGLFDDAMKAMASVPLVIWVNLSVPRSWESANNRAIAAGIQEYANARMVDWHAASSGHPEYFWQDGYHPRALGARLYATLIAAAID
ncbi:MAG: acyltransferase [Chloroflexi bacterium]|nr:MAG: acyltransferase [Chloroflexota bacterium]